jgi:hypothetical protein
VQEQQLLLKPEYQVGNGEARSEKVLPAVPQTDIAQRRQSENKLDSI